MTDDLLLKTKEIKFIAFTMVDEFFECIAQVGEGTYGKVYKARCKESGKMYALKKIRMETEKEGFPVTAVREIKLLKNMNHPNVVNLEKIVAPSPEGIYLVFEYLEYDLSGLIQRQLSSSINGTSSSIFSSKAMTKSVIFQILKGLEYLHSHQVIHRDIKGSNILLDRKGIVKLADFGLAKVFRHLDRFNEGVNIYDPKEMPCNRMMTNRVITLWYRPPEILLGSLIYGPEVDMWGVGCILVEMITGRAPFTAQDEIGQLEAIVNKLGPLPSNIHSLNSLPWLSLFKDDNSSIKSSGTDVFWSELKSLLDSEGIDLVKSLLSLDPNKRIQAKDALNHSWFKREPLPQVMPIILDEDCHEYECKNKRSLSERTRKTESSIRSQ